MKKNSGLIAVTGAAGLIGSAVVRELNRRGYSELLLVDHLGRSEKWMNLRSLSYRRYMEKEDFLARVVSNADSDRDVRDMTTIIHLGACSSTTELDASYLAANNYDYSRILAEFARERNIRMVYASSAATYGDGANGYEDKEERLEELRPLNPYGYSKHMFDLWLKQQDFKPLFAGIKYFNVFGPNEYHKGEMQSVVLKAFRQIREDGKIRLFKSYHDNYAHGEQKRDFLYVEDAARMTCYLALDNLTATGLYNAGSGRAETWLALANGVFEALKKKPHIEFIKMPRPMRPRYQYYTRAPMEKLKQAGYATDAAPLADSIADYVRNYLMPGELRA